MARKRKHPGDSSALIEDNASLPSGESASEETATDTSEISTVSNLPGGRKRAHPAETQHREATDSTSERPSLSDAERKMFENGGSTDPANAPGQKLETPPFLKRSFVGLLVLGFGLLAFFFLLQTTLAINAILSWSPWVAWPLVALICILIAYVVFRLAILLYRFRALRKINRGGSSDPRDRNASERRTLRVELVKHLNVIAKQEATSNPALANDAQDLIASADKPSTAWLEQYDREIQKPLAEAAKQDVHKIALAAGVSAAFSPWRLLDTLIAFNASIEAAHCVLRRFGISPDTSAIVAFAFDTFLTTFFAAAVDEITEDLAQDLSERLGGELSGKAVGLLGPKLAQGLGIAYFVRRLGRRMIRRLETVRL